MFHFRLDEGIFVKCFLNCHLLFSPSGNNSTPHWLHAPTSTFLFKAYCWQFCMGVSHGQSVGSAISFLWWSVELWTEYCHFAQAHHYAHCNHCPSPLLIDLMGYSKATRIVEFNSSSKDPRKIYFYLWWNFRLNAI